MRANRLLGANLVENNLVRIEDFEKANERLFEVIEQGTIRDASLLKVKEGVSTIEETLCKVSPDM